MNPDRAISPATKSPTTCSQSHCHAQPTNNTVSKLSNSNRVLAEDSDLELESDAGSLGADGDAVGELVPSSNAAATTSNQHSRNTSSFSGDPDYEVPVGKCL